MNLFQFISSMDKQIMANVTKAYLSAAYVLSRARRDSLPLKDVLS